MTLQGRVRTVDKTEEYLDKKLSFHTHTNTLTSDALRLLSQKLFQKSSALSQVNEYSV